MRYLSRVLATIIIRMDGRHQTREFQESVCNSSNMPITTCWQSFQMKHRQRPQQESCIKRDLARMRYINYQRAWLEPGNFASMDRTVVEETTSCRHSVQDPIRRW